MGVPSSAAWKPPSNASSRRAIAHLPCVTAALCNARRGGQGRTAPGSCTYDPIQVYTNLIAAATGRRATNVFPTPPVYDPTKDPDAYGSTGSGRGPAAPVRSGLYEQPPRPAGWRTRLLILSAAAVAHAQRRHAGVAGDIGKPAHPGGHPLRQPGRPGRLPAGANRVG